MRIILNGKATAEQLIQALQLCANKGANIGIVWSRDAKTRKSFAGIIRKHVLTFVRYGVDYANIGAVRDAIADGTRQAVQALPWGQWRKGREGLVIEHNGQEYVRLESATLSNLPTLTAWELDGKAVKDFATIVPNLLASETAEHDKPLVFNVKPQSVQAVFVNEPTATADFPQLPA